MSEAVKSQDLIFIDLEASGLSASSWPIEIGWVSFEGAAKSILIKPHESWPLTAWDPSAEALHGISLDKLSQKGRTCPEVCELVNADLRGKTVYSDAPDWDSFWLMRAFRACEMKPSFIVADFLSLFPSGLTPEAIAKAEAISPRAHRAAADAEHLRTLYNMALDAH